VRTSRCAFHFETVAEGRETVGRSVLSNSIILHYYLNKFQNLECVENERLQAPGKFRT